MHMKTGDVVDDFTLPDQTGTGQCSTQRTGVVGVKPAATADLRADRLANAVRPNLALVECGGVGYAAAISLSTYGLLPEVGTTVVLHTELLVRENEITSAPAAFSTASTDLSESSA